MWATALFCLTAALYAPSLNDGFLTLDDRLLIVDNRCVQPPHDDLRRVWQAPLFEIYMPLTYTLWAGESSWARRRTSGGVGELLPEWFHAVCVLLHAANTVLALALLVQLGAPTWAAAAGALLFGVHPLQVQSVYWITETKGTLSGFLSLAALSAFARFTDAAAPRAQRAMWYGLASACFALALLAKPSAVALPLLAFLIDVAWLRGRWRDALLAVTPWLLLAAAVAWIAKGAQADELLEFIPHLYQRPLVALDAWAFYVRKLLFPWDLALDYARAPQAVLSAPGPTLAWSAVAAAALVALIWNWRRRRDLAAAGLVFTAELLPVLGLVSFAYQTYSTVADRYAYLALLGPAALLARWLGGGTWRRALPAAAVLVLLAGVNLWQGQFWQTSRGLYEHSLTVCPQGWLLRTKLALLDGAEADAAAAAGHIAEAQRLRQRELARYHELLQIKPDLAGARANLGFLLLRQDRPGEAADEFAAILATRPHEPRAHTGLGIALFQLGRTEEAVREFQEVVRLRPRRTTARMQLGLALLKLRQYSAAAEEFQHVLSDAPDAAEPRLRLAQAMQLQGRVAEAIHEYRRVISARKNHRAALADLAWLLAVHGDERIRQPTEALALAKRACADAASLDDPLVQDILAAALAATGEYALAEQTAAKAAVLAERQGTTKLAAEIRAHAAAYAQEQPVVEPLPAPRAAAEIRFELGDSP